VIQRPDTCYQLYESRYGVLSEDKQLERHQKLLYTLGPQGMSSDESNHDIQPPIYCRRKPAWRSHELQAFLWHLDDLVDDITRKPIGNRRLGPNQRIRQRIVTDDVSDNSVAPPGLPENCYDPIWLKSLSHSQHRKLKIKPNHKLTLPNIANNTVVLEDLIDFGSSDEELL
jgi:hypothetical protein